MGRYRVGLNLELQKFDTQGIVKRFAEDPYNLPNIQAIYWLRHQAATTALWNAVSSFKDVTQNLDRVSNLYLGVSGDSAKAKCSIDAAAISKLSDADRKELYKRMCARAGVSISDEMLAKASAKKE